MTQLPFGLYHLPSLPVPDCRHTTPCTKLMRHRLFHHPLQRSRLLLTLISVAVVSGLLSGCVYRPTISQGNLIKAEDLEEVRVGMTRNQVRFLLGTPMIDDPFHRDRWDYVYYIKVGRKATAAKRWTSVVFDDDRVSEIHRDLELDPKL